MRNPFAWRALPGTVLAVIEVASRRSMDGWLCRVGVRHDDREHRYRVRVSEDAWQRLTGGRAPVEELVRASFEFLLEREGPESILEAFEVNVIPRYFPDYERAMQARFAATP
jgi:hypothetical protein